MSSRSPRESLRSPCARGAGVSRRLVASIVCLFVLAICVLACGSSPPSGPPNIVLIISDDHGWPDFGFAGSPIVKTPNLDALAKEGVVFSHAFNTGSTCRPALQTLLTGFHPFQVDARAQAFSMEERKNLDENLKILLFKTLPEFLAERGYASFQGGKYWEGSYQMGGFTHGMTTVYGENQEAGFDLDRFSGAGGLGLGRETMQPIWDFIAEHQRERSDRPFFVWFAPMLPHAPYDTTRDDRAPYRDLDLSEAALGYYANISRLDARIGELLDHLEAKGLRDDTVIVFLSDNGWVVPNDDSLYQQTFGGPGGKASLLELGFRTPLIFSWPDHFEGGVENSSLVSTVDIFPTLLELAGLKAPANRPGESLLPLLTSTGGYSRENVMAGVNVLRGQPVAGQEPRVTDSAIGMAFYFRDQDWSYSWYGEQGRDELHRVLDGVAQGPDVGDGFPEVGARLRKKIRGAYRQLTDEVRTPAKN